MISRREFLKTAIALPTCLSIAGRANSSPQKPAHLLRLASPLFDRYWNKETFEITDYRKCIVNGDTPVKRYWYYNLKDSLSHCDVIIPQLEVKINNPVPGNPEESCREAVELMFDAVEKDCRDTIVAAGLSDRLVITSSYSKVVEHIKRELGKTCHIFTGWKENLIVGIKKNSGKLVMPIFHEPTVYYKHEEYGEGPLALVKLGIAVLDCRAVCAGYVTENLDTFHNPAHLQPAILS